MSAATSGFFKVSESWETCQTKVDGFKDISFGSLISNENKPAKYKIRATYLYATRAQKKYRTFQPARGSLAQVNKDITTVFIRFWDTSLGPCYGMFFENASCD